MSKLNFDNRVAIITGAGRGLGRSYALALAERGAKVVVNDLGGSTFGGGADTSAADAVVAEIRANGGDAVASHDSVLEGDKIVQIALDTYGQVDIVINNAGILRDASFHKMTDDDWDLVYNVHVKGAYAVTHAAWPHMRERAYGRLIFTASAAGIYGNFGQANYSMAKIGLYGLSRTLNFEGKKLNIVSNTIAPFAGSRMTETVLPPEVIEKIKPEYVMPLVVKLCSEEHTDGGGLYEVGAGWFGRLRWERTAGITFELSSELTPELLSDNWDPVVDFSNATHPRHVGDALAPLYANINKG